MTARRRPGLSAAVLTCGAVFCLGQQPYQNAPPAYRLADGSVQIVADTEMAGLLSRLNALYERRHPETRITLKLDTSGMIGLGGITTGASPVSPMLHQAYPQEDRPFVQMQGHEPVDIIIGHLGCWTPTNMPLPALYVNAGIPPFTLTWSQVARILTRGSLPGDITRWEQIGVGQGWREHAIHVYGPADDGGFVSALRHSAFSGNQLTFRYEALADADDIAAAVQRDAYGIGLIEKWNRKSPPVGLRMVPISKTEGSGRSTGQCSEVIKGEYPMNVDVHIYINRQPGQPVDPISLEYVRLALSEKGQLAIAQSRSGSGAHFLPLSRRAIASELAKLD